MGVLSFAGDWRSRREALLATPLDAVSDEAAGEQVSL